MRAKLVAMERAGALVAGPAPPGARARPPSRGQGAASAAVGFTPSSWAHELPAPEVGCLLVAKQPGMDFFDGTVVLIAAHGALGGRAGQWVDWTGARSAHAPRGPSAFDSTAVLRARVPCLPAA